MTNDPYGVLAVVFFVVGFGIVCFGFFTTRFYWLENRIDRLERKLDKSLVAIDRKEKTGLSRRELAEEFRVQRAEVAAHISAITKALNASHQP
jgi:hypothetical protein